MTTLKELLSAPEILLAPGIYDALSGLMAERAGFKAVYLSGASIAYTRFGRPDIGLVSLSEVTETLGTIAERVNVPIVVDGDTGFGNALNVQRTVRLFERGGAAAIQLEDQTLPKRCGHLQDKNLIGSVEMTGKIKAALDARGSDDFLIIARTDAIAVEGFETALDRAEAYVEAGADMLFVEAPQDRDQMKALCDRFEGRVPLMANMVEGGKTPILPTEMLQELGYGFVIFPGGTVRALAHHLDRYFASLAEHGTTAPFMDQMLDFKGLTDLVGTPEMLALGKKYDGR
ncbi:MAG: oxaloacetate decarboxylase [Alphaproteobacteria bacterium]|nr:oxaloacetate decarboxylase [Alphaproteobacteria bacterium]